MANYGPFQGFADDTDYNMKIYFNGEDLAGDPHLYRESEDSIRNRDSIRKRDRDRMLH